MEDKKNFDDEVLLTTVADLVEAQIIESLLKTNDISINTRFRGTGAYMSVYMGNSKHGIDIYVGARNVERAKQLLEAESELSELQVSEEQEFLEEQQIAFRKKRIKALILLFLFISGALVSVIYFLVHFLTNIFT